MLPLSEAQAWLAHSKVGGNAEDGEAQEDVRWASIGMAFS